MYVHTFDEIWPYSFPEGAKHSQDILMHEPDLHRGPFEYKEKVGTSSLIKYAYHG